MNQAPTLTLDPTFLRSLAAAFASLTEASTLPPKKARFFAALTLPPLEGESDDALNAYFDCLSALASRRALSDLDGTETPLPPYDPEDSEFAPYFDDADIFLGLLSYYLYRQGQIEKPSLALRPVSFLFYEIRDGLIEGHSLSSDLAKEQYQKFKERYQSPMGEKVVASLDAFISERFGV